MFSKYLDTVSKCLYNKRIDTVSACADNDEGLSHEESNTGTDHFVSSGREQLLKNLSINNFDM